MKLKIIGTIFGTSGFDSHTRQLANAINKLEDIDVILEVPTLQGWELQVNDEELKMVLRNKEDYDVCLFIGQPQYLRLYNDYKHPMILFLIWEGDKIPQYWIKYLLDENVKQIWVPSEHVKKAIERTVLNNDKCIKIMNEKNLQNINNYKSLKKKIKIVPHGVDLSIFYPTNTQQPEVIACQGGEDNTGKTEVCESNGKDSPESLAENFIFLVDKGWRNLNDRGGTQDTVRAYLEEFSEEDDVELIIKINPAYQMGNILEMIEQLKPKYKTSFASIKIIKDAVPFEKLNEIYNLGDVFVNSSKAEAFHLGCLQAMACGLPVITNDFGGMIDYINDKNGWILKNGKMREVTWEIEYESIYWKDINIQELRKKMRYVYNNKKEVIEKGIKSMETSKQFTWKKSSKKAYKCLSSIL